MSFIREDLLLSCWQFVVGGGGNCHGGCGSAKAAQDAVTIFGAADEDGDGLL